MIHQTNYSFLARFNCLRPPIVFPETQPFNYPEYQLFKDQRVPGLVFAYPRIFDNDFFSLIVSCVFHITPFVDPKKRVSLYYIGELWSLRVEQDADGVFFQLKNNVPYPFVEKEGEQTRYVEFTTHSRYFTKDYFPDITVF